ncbi:MAG: bifunctional nuclease family protein [Anaerolineae bacterium]
MVPVTIESVRVSLVSQHRLIVLREQGGDRFLPIYIGAFEAEAITIRLQGATPARPMTHDLLQRVINQMGGELLRVVIVDLRKDTFYADIYVRRNGEEMAIDARPSDAVALAVRSDIPVFVAESVMDSAAIQPDPSPWLEAGGEAATGEDMSIFRDFIDSLDLDDLEH